MEHPNRPYTYRSVRRAGKTTNKRAFCSAASDTGENVRSVAAIVGGGSSIQVGHSGTLLTHTPLPIWAYGLQDLGLEELLYKPARRSLIVPISNQERHQSPLLCKSYSEESRSPPCEPKNPIGHLGISKNITLPSLALGTSAVPLGCPARLFSLNITPLALRLGPASLRRRPIMGKGRHTHTQPTNRAGGVALPFTDPDQPAAQHDISLSPSHFNRLGWVYARSPNQGSIFGSFSIVC